MEVPASTIRQEKEIKCYSKGYIERQRLRITNKLKKNKFDKLTIPSFLDDYKAFGIMPTWCGYSNRYKDRWKRIRSAK